MVTASIAARCPASSGLEHLVGELCGALDCAHLLVLFDLRIVALARGCPSARGRVNTVTTNVPGPQHAIYFAGQRMLEYFPFVPLGGHVRIGVAIVSFDGALNFGVTGDYETAPDIQVLCDGIEAAIAELLPRTAPSAAAPRRSARAAPRGRAT